MVQVGDLYDLYAYSKFPRSQNIYTPAEEERLSRQAAEKFFSDIIRDNKKANVFNMLGNHDLRIIKRTIKKIRFKIRFSYRVQSRFRKHHKALSEKPQKGV